MSPANTFLPANRRRGRVGFFRFCPTDGFDYDELLAPEAAPAGGSEGAGAEIQDDRSSVRPSSARRLEPIGRDAGRLSAADAGRSTSGRASCPPAKCIYWGAATGTRSDASSCERSRRLRHELLRSPRRLRRPRLDSGTRRTTDGGPASPANSGSSVVAAVAAAARLLCLFSLDSQASNACRRAQGAASRPAHRGPGRATQPDGPPPPPPGRHRARFRPRSSSAGRRPASRRRSQSPRPSRARIWRRARQEPPPRRRPTPTEQVRPRRVLAGRPDLTLQPGSRSGSLRRCSASARSRTWRARAPVHRQAPNSP